MKKIIVGFILMMVASIALALPSPRDIENALLTKHYTEAKGMVHEVLREKPESARAHLLNAYLLAHVDKNREAANAELNTASGLDKKGDVKNSPLFGRVVAEIETTKPALAPAVQQVAKSYPPVAEKRGPDAGDFLVYILIIGIAAMLLVALIGIVVNMFKTEKTVVHTFTRNRDDYFNEVGIPSRPIHPSSGGSAAYTPAQAQVLNTAPAVVIAGGAMGGGMGAFGTAASVAGGVVAGNVISDMLHHGRHNSSYDDDEYERRRRRERESSYTEDSWVSTSMASATPAASYEADRKSYSSGSDDSWSSTSSGSYDSGSSSSSDSSSSSSWD